MMQPLEQTVRRETIKDRFRNIYNSLRDSYHNNFMHDK